MMVFLQILLFGVVALVLLGVMSVLAMVFGLRQAVKNLNAHNNPQSRTAREAEAGRVVFEARPCPHCGTYLSEPPVDGRCPSCGGKIDGV